MEKRGGFEGPLDRGRPPKTNSILLARFVQFDKKESITKRKKKNL